MLKPFSAFLVSVISLGAFAQWSHLRTNVALAKFEGVNSDQQMVPDPNLLKIFSLGYDQVLGDVYWLAFIQYIGNTEARKKDGSILAYRYLNLITLLDPHFLPAYWFAAFSVGAEQVRPDLAQKIIERGVQNNQDNWSLPFIAGINQYLFAHNDAAAAKFYRLAAKYPSAPGWLVRQADILQAKIPSILKDISVYSNIYASSSNTLVKAKAREKLIAMWQEVYSRAPNKKIENKAATALRELESQDSTD